MKLGTESNENVPKDRLITIVSRLYNEMNKPSRYTIIHCMLLVNLHTQASQTSCDEYTAADMCDFLHHADMRIYEKKNRNLLGLRKNMQSKMIFKDHIDRLSTDVRVNNNYDMVCEIIFFPRFYISDFL